MMVLDAFILVELHTVVTSITTTTARPGMMTHGYVVSRSPTSFFPLASSMALLLACWPSIHARCSRHISCVLLLGMGFQYVNFHHLNFVSFSSLWCLGSTDSFHLPRTLSMILPPPHSRVPDALKGLLTLCLCGPCSKVLREFHQGYVSCLHDELLPVWCTCTFHTLEEWLSPVSVVCGDLQQASTLLCHARALTSTHVLSAYINTQIFVLILALLAAVFAVSIRRRYNHVLVVHR